MATKTKGKNLSLTINAQEVNAEGTSVVLDNEEADTDAITFADLANGTPLQWFFTVEAIADYGTGSFWTTIWNNSGSTVAYVLKPYGNTTASTTQPHFTGNCTILAKPPIGGTANETFTFEARLDCTATPTRVTT
jgi:hypothetical protein